MNPEGYEHLNTPWMNMKVGDLVSIIWTEGCETPAIIGVVSGGESHTPLFDRDGSLGHMAQLEHASRQRIEILTNGKHSWCAKGDLRVIA
jgi:hypothetical protein